MQSSSFDTDTGRVSTRVDDEAGPGRVTGRARSRQFSQSGEQRTDDVKLTGTAAENPIARENATVAMTALSRDMPVGGGVMNLHQNVRQRLIPPARSARRWRLVRFWSD
eukprot:COSAG02_NODE_7597_length_2942_cov_8.737953_1_plen_109_part_00